MGGSRTKLAFPIKKCLRVRKFLGQHRIGGTTLIDPTPFSSAKSASRLAACSGPGCKTGRRPLLRNLSLGLGQQAQTRCETSTDQGWPAGRCSGCLSRCWWRGVCAGGAGVWGLMRSLFQRNRSSHICRISAASGVRNALGSSMVTTGMPLCTPP